MKTLTVKGTVFGEGMPKICLPIMGKTESEIMETAGRISGLPHDVVEWRADAFQHFSSHRQVLHILAALRQVLPDSLLLFTFRTLREGGKHDISDEAYLALNEAVIRSSLADFVDLELFTGTEAVAAAELPAPEDSLLAPLISLARQTQVQTILSSHDFAKTPPMGELLERLSAMEALGCSIAKLAVMPHKKKGCADAPVSHPRSFRVSGLSRDHHVHGRPRRDQPHLRGIFRLLPHLRKSGRSLRARTAGRGNPFSQPQGAARNMGNRRPGPLSVIELRRPPVQAFLTARNTAPGFGGVPYSSTPTR